MISESTHFREAVQEIIHFFRRIDVDRIRRIIAPLRELFAAQLPQRIGFGPLRFNHRLIEFPHRGLTIMKTRADCHEVLLGFRKDSRVSQFPNAVQIFSSADTRKAYKTCART